MTPETTTLAAVGIGGLFTLLGSTLNLLFQWLQQKWTFKRSRLADLHSKQLVALQNCVQLVDFLIAAKGKQLGGDGDALWVNIRKENVSNGIFFPEGLQGDFKKTIRGCLLIDDLSEASEVLDTPTLERLRSQCVKYIQSEYK